MKIYDYREALVEDITKYITENINFKNYPEDIEELHEEIYEQVVYDKNITGNNNYPYCSRAEQAEKCLKDNEVLLDEAIYMAGLEDQKEEIINDPMRADTLVRQHLCDSCVRQAIYNAKDHEEVKEWLTEQIKDLTDGGCYKVSPSGYDDYINERRLLECFNEYTENDHGYPYFDHYLYEKLDELFWNADEPFFDEIDDLAAKEGYEFKEKYDNYMNYKGINEAMEECGYTGLSYDVADFLNHNYHINLMFATPAERNHDMGAVNEFFMDRDRLKYDNPEKDDRWDNALTYLIRQQDYDVEEIISTYDKFLESYTEFEDFNHLPEVEDKFINSIASELLDFPSHYGCAELTALVSMSGQELLDVLNNIAHGTGNIELSKDTTLGIYEEWNGAGSQFDIQLNQPAIFPASMVRNVQIEKAGREPNRGWTVDDTYGLIGSCWKGSCTVTQETPVLKEFDPTELQKINNQKDEVVKD